MKTFALTHFSHAAITMEKMWTMFKVNNKRHQNDANIFKVDNKNSVFIANIEHISHLLPVFLLLNFEQVNAGWVINVHL